MTCPPNWTLRLRFIMCLLCKREYPCSIRSTEVKNQEWLYSQPWCCRDETGVGVGVGVSRASQQHHLIGETQILAGDPDSGNKVDGF